jgi:hypothetical protein
MKRRVLLVLAVAVAGVAAMTGPAAATERSGALHVTKECSQYTGQAGSFCTITGSNLKTIDAGAKVVYAQSAGATGLDSDLVVAVGPGNVAFGHVTLAFSTLSGVVTFSGGRGQFRHFQARADVTYDAASNRWHWDGTYRFGGSNDDD